MHEKHSIRNLVLTYSSAEVDHSRLFGLEGDIVDTSDIADYIDCQAQILVQVEIDHVSK
jgi:hypothetical protein